MINVCIIYQQCVIPGMLVLLRLLTWTLDYQEWVEREYQEDFNMNAFFYFEVAIMTRYRTEDECTAFMCFIFTSTATLLLFDIHAGYITMHFLLYIECFTVSSLKCALMFDEPLV